VKPAYRYIEAALASRTDYKIIVTVLIADFGLCAEQAGKVIADWIKEESK